LLEAATTILLLAQGNQAADHLISRLLGSYKNILWMPRSVGGFAGGGGANQDFLVFAPILREEIKPSPSCRWQRKITRGVAAKNAVSSLGAGGPQFESERPDHYNPQPPVGELMSLRS